MVPVDVAIALICEGGRWLVQCRPAGKHLAGTWEFPGGKVSEGEDPEGALLRELREELDVGVAIVEPLPVVRHDYPARRVVLHPYRCRITQGEPRPMDGQTIRWVTPEELSTLPTPQANQPLVEALGAYGD